MGINSRTTKYFPEMLSAMGVDSWKGINMLEYGNQLYRGKNAPFRTAKQYFNSLGANHVSIDKNGKDGALPLDLRETISGVGEPFDIVTNFGTSEHVKNEQFQPFKTMHDMVKTGGVLVSIVPEVGFLEEHGNYHYTKYFFWVLAKKNGYVIHLLESEKHFRVKRNLIVFIAIKKFEHEFISREVFDNIFKYVKVMK